MDDKALEPIWHFIGGNWGWILAILSALFEFTPIKVHPISALLGWVGKKLNGNIKQDIADLRKDVDEQRMSNVRTLVLDFSNSCLNGRKHTKEEFDHILEENKKYNKLIARYPDVENDVYTEAIAYIKRIYRKRQDRRDFLSASNPEGENQDD